VPSGALDATRILAHAESGIDEADIGIPLGTDLHSLIDPNHLSIDQTTRRAGGNLTSLPCATPEIAHVVNAS
jgi:hypothetical protein